MEMKKGAARGSVRKQERGGEERKKGERKRGGGETYVGASDKNEKNLCYI